jgi:hypothetical protein
MRPLQRKLWLSHIVALIAALMVLGIVTACDKSERPSAGSIPPGSRAPSPDPNTLMWALYDGFGQSDHGAIGAMALSGDTPHIPVLIEFLFSPRISNRLAQMEAGEALRQLSGQRFSNDDWEDWVKWLGSQGQIRPPAQFASWKSSLLKGIHLSLGTFLYDGAPARIRIEEIVWGGVPKDGIPDLRNPPHIQAKEAAYLQPSDRVFGVSIRGEHRAYPLRIMNPHEMANDALGGEPFALAY